MGLMEPSDWKDEWIGVTPPEPPVEHLDPVKPGDINVALVAASAGIGRRSDARIPAAMI